MTEKRAKCHKNAKESHKMSEKFAYIKKKVYFCGQFFKPFQIMPKQSGLYQVKGKYENRSYYRPKNMSMGVFRSINQAMSDRVKTEPNFAITRANAAEFGCATSWANQVSGFLNQIAPISNLTKKRGDIVRAAKGMIEGDMTHEFGKRSLRAPGWPETMSAMLNQMPRISFDGTYGGEYSFYSAMGTTSNPNEYYTHVSIPANPQLAARLAEYGATDVEIKVTLCRWWAGYYSSLLSDYYPTELATFDLGTYHLSSLPVNVDVPVDYPLDGSYPANAFMKVLVCITPTKIIGGVTYRLEHLRSFKFFDLAYGGPSIANVQYLGQTHKPGSDSFEVDRSAGQILVVNFQEVNLTTGTITASSINGKTTQRTIISATELQMVIPESLDGEFVRVVSISHNGTTYTANFS